MRWQGLRYKDYQHVCSEQVDTGRLDVSFGSSKEFITLKDLAADLKECGVTEWWEEAMGFMKAGQKS